jgi:purine nucleosidase
MRRSLVIDTVTASDDAVALLLAVRDPAIDVRAVTVVAGNVPLDPAVRNAIVTLDLCGGAEISVYTGRKAPLSRLLETAQFVQGEDGMGGARCPNRPDHRLQKTLSRYFSPSPPPKQVDTNARDGPDSASGF